MFYKSSILAANFVLLSIGNAIASEIPTVQNSIAAPQPDSIVNTAATNQSTAAINLDLDPAKDWKMSAVSPLSNALPVDNRSISQTPSSTLEPDRENKKNHVGLTVGSIFNIPAYGINAKFGVSDNISVRPFIQFAKAPSLGSIPLFI